MKEMETITRNNVIDVDLIIDSTIELISILRSENTCLLKGEVGEIEILQPRKTELIETLSYCKEMLILNPEAQNDVNRHKLAHVKLLQNELQETMKENMNYLSTSIKVNRKIIDSIKDGFLSETKKILGYNSDAIYGYKFKSSKELPSFALKNYI